MDKKPEDEYDPTGYYRRKHKRNMEYADKVLIPFFKWTFVGTALYGLIECLRERFGT